jgi:YfiH family protein
MQIIYSKLLRRFPEIIFGMSTKNGLDRVAPFYFNLSLNVGDDPDLVRRNREYFFERIGLQSSEIAYQKQIHSDIIKVADQPGIIGESDAMITTKNRIGLAISTADCTPIFIYDEKNKLIAAVHSGWRGTSKRILSKTLSKLMNEFNSVPENLFVYIGPSISKKNYEVGKEVADQFDEKYLVLKGDKFLLDVSGANLDMLIEAGIPELNIGKSNFCTFQEKDLLHSYRRDGKNSGRSLGIIALK